MTVRNIHTALLGLLLLVSGHPCAAQGKWTGRIVDAVSAEPVVGAAVTQGSAWSLTDSTGFFVLSASGPGSVTISSMGYQTLQAPLSEGHTYRLQPDIRTLQEAVITATEERGVTAVSTIGKEAIDHIQPSSLKDLLELLPGGRALDPNLASPQLVNLRSAASLSTNYATSALGTAVMVDGRPIGNNANLQYTPGYSSLGSDYVNFGTDLRSVSTEDIESVEVVRGIASVEYGDLTSGLMKIVRRRGGKDLRARFKSDMGSKLFYVGKDYEWKGGTLNAGVNFLDAQADPRNPRQNYKRLTGTVRLGKTWEKDLKSALNVSLDYTGSFDDRKSDENLDFGSLGPVETYRSSYNKVELSAEYTLSARDGASLFRNWTTTVSASLENDLIDRWKYNINGAEQPFSVSSEPGEWDALILPVRYESTLQVKGRPFYAYAHSVVTFKTGVHRIKGGAEWTMDKNFGEGSVFDISRPFSRTLGSRPRPYYAIPANHQLSLFAEEAGTAPLGRWSLEWAAGIRMSALAGAGKAFRIDWKPYLDPRANLRLNFPATVVAGHRLEAGLYAGGGLHTKFPTMDMLFPDPIYGDIQEFNYWPVEKELRRSYNYVYKVDPTNYELGPARNLKLEVGLDATWRGFRFSVDGFREDMTSGFRTSSEYGRQIYRKYDGSGIDKSTLTAPPDVTTLPFQADTLLYAYGVTTNGSRTLKQGIEFTFSSPRIPAIGTRITANGAWFVTKNANSVPLYYVPTAIISGNRYSYVGRYEVQEGSTYTSLTTNLMLDTQIPRLGLILSTSFQTAWFSNHYPVERDAAPVAYLDKNLIEHPFTEADAKDPVLRYLVQEKSAMTYDYLVPFATYVNLKATKKLYRDRIACSLFVNRLLALTPDSYMNGAFVRRSSTPYFGMELTVKL